MISAIVARGFGSFGSAVEIPTRGFAMGEGGAPAAGNRQKMSLGIGISLTMG